MTSTKDLNALILNGISKAQKDELAFNNVYTNRTNQNGSNEFLFFIKPELTIESETIEHEKLISLLLEKIDEFNFNIHNINVLSSSYLKRHKIAEQHYGVINKISSNPELHLSDSSKEKFKYLYGLNIENTEYFGGHQFLKKFTDETSTSLNNIWDTSEDAWKHKYQHLPSTEVEKLNKANNVKLGGGTYCKTIIKNDKPYVVLNGFNPSQIEHFTKKGRNIVTMTLSSNLTWKEARNNFIGKTNPIDASMGSIRKTLLENQKKYGLDEVTQGMNGVHLSAGPVEALIELKRFNSNFDDLKTIRNYTDFNFGLLLKNTFPEDFDSIIENTNIMVDNKATSIFDLTEEQDTETALNILKKHYKKSNNE